MIAGQVRPNRVSDERTIAALEAVPREHFVPKALRGVAYVDEDLEVVPGRYLLEPRVFARMITEAAVTAGETVLDVACATGYSTAVLARLAEAVVAVEESEELVQMATQKLTALGVDNAAVIQAPLNAGVAKQGPFDVILLNGAVEEVPKALTDQLADGGRLVCVQRRDGISRAVLMTRSGDAIGGRDLFDAYVPLLPGFERPRTFQF